jgi:hypothetical protein
MPAIKFSQLPLNNAPTGDGILPLVVANQNYKLTLNSLKTFVTPDWNSVIGKPVFHLVATSGDYRDLNNKPAIPTIPSNVSSFVNDRNYLTSVDYSIITNPPPLADVATSGEYADLLNVPTLTTSTLVNGIFKVSLASDGVLDIPAGGDVLRNGVSAFAPSGGSGNGSLIQSSTAPTGSTSTLWYDTVGGRSYVYYDAGWVDASPMPTVDTTQLVNNGYSLGLDSAGIVNLPTFAGSPSIAIIQTASAGISLNANGAYFNFNQNGSLTWPNSSVQTGAAISIADLKTLVAASTSFEDFQVRIAAL